MLKTLKHITKDGSNSKIMAIFLLVLKWPYLVILKWPKQCMLTSAIFAIAESSLISLSEVTNVYFTSTSTLK